MGKSFGNMSGKSISLGLGARNLRDRDFFGVSDPYVVISRPNPSGGFTKIRTSETKKNTLNPNWNDFLFTESELNGYDKNLKLEEVRLIHHSSSQDQLIPLSRALLDMEVED